MTLKKASPAVCRRVGAEWAMMLWQRLQEEGETTVMDGDWAHDYDAHEAATAEKCDVPTFTESAKKAWLRAQKAWRKDR